jgi:hypothetical protein
MQRAQAQPHRSSCVAVPGRCCCCILTSPLNNTACTCTHAPIRTLPPTIQLHPICTHLYYLRLPCFDPPAAASSMLARFDCTVFCCGVPPLPISAASPCPPRVMIMTPHAFLTHLSAFMLSSAPYLMHC